MIIFNQSRLSANGRFLRGIVLGISAAPIAGAVLYNHSWQLSEHPCLFQQIMGFPSPGCGMTRSFVAIARGDWNQAFMYHGFGPLVFGAFAIAAIHTSIELTSGRSLTARYIRWCMKPAILVAGAALFLGYYGLRLYARYPGADAGLPFGWANHSLWQLIVAGAQRL
ncbi:MAG: DUF2752 domain-containing protein [Elainellaceae cyanobacterium]